MVAMGQLEEVEDCPGFFRRWVLPVIFVGVVVGAFWLLGRVSTPVIEVGAETPDGHFSSACVACHRVE
jgi:hypothetical protein